MTELGPKDAIGSKHPNVPQPATHQRGSRPIDGIFASPESQIERAGWLPPEESPGDHRAGCVDVKWTSLLGEDVLKVARPDARRLTCKFGSVKGKHRESLEEFVKQHRPLQKVMPLQHKMGLRRDPEDGLRLNQLDKIREEGMKCAERKCRRKRMGSHPHSKELNQAMRLKEFWQRVWERAGGQ